MKVYFIAVVLAPSSGTSVILAQSNDLSSFSFFQRPSVTEFMTFTSITLAERTPPEERKRIGKEDKPQDNTPQENKQEDNYVFHVYKRSVPEHLAGKFSLTWMFLECSSSSH